MKILQICAKCKFCLPDNAPGSFCYALPPVADPTGDPTIYATRPKICPGDVACSMFQSRTIQEGDQCPRTGFDCDKCVLPNDGGECLGGLEIDS